MTSPREYMEAIWPVKMPGVPLVDASNTEIETDDLPSPWVGMLVQVERYGAVTLGSAPYNEETGTVLLGVFTKAGDGGTPGDALARVINPAFLNWRSSDAKFEIRQIQGPYDLEPESDGNWHRLALELNYGLWSGGPP